MTFILLAHILLVVFAFGALLFPELFFHRIAARCNDVATLRVLFGLATARGRIAAPALLVGALVGLWYAHAAGYSLTAGWLIASYVVLICIFAVGGSFARREQRCYKLAQESPDGAPSAELRAAIASDERSPMGYIALLLFVAIFYLMIAKPF